MVGFGGGGECRVMVVAVVGGVGEGVDGLRVIVWLEMVIEDALDW